MGTRGAYGVKVDGQYKVTYNHFDSYPSKLGKDIVKFCNKVTEDDSWDEFIEKMRSVKLVDEHKVPSKKLQKKYAHYADLNVGEQKIDDWYCLLRNLQNGEILRAILNGDIEHMIDSFEFLKDSLFCEYVYIINLDEMKLEFYEGYNKRPQKNNPLPFEQVPLPREYKGAEDYYPVRFLGSVPLNKIPKNWMKKFYPEEAKIS
jgi:hypothetical protein